MKPWPALRPASRRHGAGVNTYVVPFLQPGESAIAWMNYGESAESFLARVMPDSPDDAWVALPGGQSFVRLGFLRAVALLQMTLVLP